MATQRSISAEKLCTGGPVRLTSVPAMERGWDGGGSRLVNDPGLIANGAINPEMEVWGYLLA